MTTINNDNEQDIEHEHEHDDDLIWYFSYGSNLNPEVFENRRKIKCRDHRVCYAPGYVLTYAEGILPYIEPAFCTCVKRELLPPLASLSSSPLVAGDRDDDNIRHRPDIHGVAFLITRRQYEHMLMTEGGWGWQEYRNHPIWNTGNYGEEEIECIQIEPVFDTDNTEDNNNGDNDNDDDNANKDNKPKPQQPVVKSSFKAMTLVGLFGAHERYDCNASQRYYDLVRVGAKTCGLPKSYRQYLKDTHPPFVMPTQPLQRPQQQLSPLPPNNASTSSSSSPPTYWVAVMARNVYILVAFPSLLLEIGTLKVCMKWNEYRNTNTDTNASSSSSSRQEKQSTSTVAKTTTTTPKRRRKRFEGVVRPPWILMKISYLYRRYVLELALSTILYDVIKIPNGFKNEHNNYNNNDSNNGSDNKNSNGNVNAFHNDKKKAE